MSQNQIITIVPASGPAMAAVLLGILINNSRLSDMNGRIWRSELRRVEEVLDGRLKHLEQR